MKIPEMTDELWEPAMGSSINLEKKPNIDLSHNHVVESVELDDLEQLISDIANMNEGLDHSLKDLVVGWNESAQLLEDIEKNMLKKGDLKTMVNNLRYKN